MKKILLANICVLAVANGLVAQIDAGLFRFPDVSQNQIVFTYANDIWVMPKEGGTALKLSSPVGVESFPKFSPDGKSIAFSGNYDGNIDAYIISTSGGIPFRITSHGMIDRVVEWTPDGGEILFASGRESEKERFSQLYTISKNGGAAKKLPLAYGEFASYSPDGNQLALVFRSEVFRTWKRYRGGDAADIYVFNLQDSSSYNISSLINAGEELPMWSGNYIYYMSDNGPEQRMNLWQYDLTTKNRKQVTNFTEYDVHFPSMGPKEIVFEAGGKLYLYQLADGQLKEVKVNLVSDRAALKPTIEKVEGYIHHVAIGQDGNRVLIEARGDIFSLPAENGYVKNLTQTSGVAERYPAWSPDGKLIAYWSDQSGEYELWVRDVETNTNKKITNYGPGFRYNLFWSPDSKRIAFVDKAMNIKIIELSSGITTDVDKALRWSHGPLEGFTANWSPDSRWLTYARDLDNGHYAVYVFDTQSKKTNQITSGYYHCDYPIFDTEGKYIYVLTNQSFQPLYSDLDNTFIYPNTTHIAAISLKKSTPSLTAPENESVEIKKEGSTDEEKEDEKEKKSDKKDKGDKDDEDDEDETKQEIVPVEIDFEGIESRLVILPMKPGNYYNLASAEGKLIYMNYPNTGSNPDLKASIKFYDFKEREEKTILGEADDFILSANTKKLLVASGGQYAVIAAEPDQKFEKQLRISEMEALVDPAKEWRQLFMDAWRFERDYFYDEGMHGVNWEQVKERYLKMLQGAMTRDEVNFVLGEMIAELNSSHTYRGGGDIEQPLVHAVGYLGVNWEADGGFYKIKKIIRPATWDSEVRSPLDMPGVEVKEGDFILAVNGIPITTVQEPFAFFQGLAGKTVELTYNSTASFSGAKTVVVQTLGDESRLRHLAWIESNRKRVEEATNGDAGYIYVRSTGVDGQNELMRQFNAQWNKKALIIDERFNNGGQIPDRFIEMLDRDPLVYWAIRDGEPWQWPPVAHFGPKVMLINGWSGSGGDAFPDYFRKKNLGPLIGARTWGGLIGISGVPLLIDNGVITAPTFRMYHLDGTWFDEGHGVEPDIHVEENLTSLSRGSDAQLERAILEIKELIKRKGYVAPQRPAPETR